MIKIKSKLLTLGLVAICEYYTNISSVVFV